METRKTHLQITNQGCNFVIEKWQMTHIEGAGETHIITEIKKLDSLQPRTTVSIEAAMYSMFLGLHPAIEMRPSFVM